MLVEALVDGGVDRWNVLEHKALLVDETIGERLARPEVWVISPPCSEMDTNIGGDWCKWNL